MKLIDFVEMLEKEQKTFERRLWFENGEEQSIIRLRRR